MKTYLLVPILMSAMLLSACGGGGSSDGGSDGDTGGSAHCSERTEYTGSIEGAGVTFQRNDCNNLIYYHSNSTALYPDKTARFAGFLCETYSYERFSSPGTSIIYKINTHCFEDNGVFVKREVTQKGLRTAIKVYDRFYDDRNMDNITGSSSSFEYGDGDQLFFEYSKEWGWEEVVRKRDEALLFAD